MAFLKTLLVGRPNGVRSKLLSTLGLKPAPDTAAATRPAARADAPPEPAERSMRLNKEPPRDVTPPEGYEVVLHKDALKDGGIVEIIIAGRAIAVANVGGAFHAIANSCPHADGPLGEGTLDGALVTCPNHGWQFDVTDGSCKTNPYAKVQTFPVQVVSTAVCVKL